MSGPEQPGQRIGGVVEGDLAHKAPAAADMTFGPRKQRGGAVRGLLRGFGQNNNDGRGFHLHTFAHR